jgi:hypothetical protein
MVRTERPFNNERQPVLPFNAAYQAMNRRDEERETQNPMQLELLPPVQPDLFIDMPSPEVDAINTTAGATRRT